MPLSAYPSHWSGSKLIPGALRCLALIGCLHGGELRAGLASAPLAAPSAPAGPTLFTLLPPEQTGVHTENRYADPKMWAEYYQEFLFGAIGTGLSIGDYDADGRPDLFVVSKTESCRLFRNLGGFKFQDVTSQAGVADTGPAAAIWKQGSTFVDVNNDGRLDLYLCRFNAPNLLYINQGDGTFKEEARARGLDITDSSGMASFGDYDRDGWLDVYIATNILDHNRHPNGQRGYLLHNRGNGTFENVTDRAGITDETQSHSAIWWDYDNDDWPDLYVANDFGVPDKLYRNNHDGTFTDCLHRAAPRTAFSSMGTDLGDVNNDGLIDLIVGDMAASTHQKDQRGSADLRGRDADVPNDSPFIPKYRSNALLLNTGTPRLLEGARLAGLAVTDWTWALLFEDLDNDGWLDLFVCNGMNKEENMDVNARMMRAESSTERIRIMRDSPKLIEANQAYRNLGNLEFRPVAAEWGLNQKTISFGAAFGDFDGDGDLDLVYSNYQAGATVLRNDGAQGHRVIVELRGTTSNRFGIGSTIRLQSARGAQVRQVWLARGYMSSGEPVAHFGLGPDEIIERLTVTWPNGRVQTFENLPANQRYTITEDEAAEAPSPVVPPPTQFAEVGAAIGFAQASSDEHFDETGRQRLLPFRLNRLGPGLAVGDITGDGRDDAVIGGTPHTPLLTLAGTGHGELVAKPDAIAEAVDGVGDGPVLLFDANGDGRNDLVVTKAGYSLPAGSPEYESHLYLNQGEGTFAPAPGGTWPAPPTSAGALAAADFDRDGRLDVFIGGRVLPQEYPFSPRSTLLRNNGDTWEDVTDKVAPLLRDIGMVTSALWSDVDRDGWPDLLVALDWGGVKYLHNEEGHAFVDRSDSAGFAAAGSGWWTALASADFNGDGAPDYAVGNLGLNSTYRASPQEPALLFAGDFRGDGDTQLVEAYFEAGSLYPRRSRRDLGNAIPTVAKRFPRNDVYALATLGEILGEDRIADAQRFAVTELRSGVFLSQPDRTYRFTPLPRIAQIAPLQGMVTGDFNGDGHADLYAVQNSFAPIPAIGRLSGGLSQLLLGDGKGGFSAVPPAQSGLVVPGNAKALAAVDLEGDGWADFLVTRNHDTTLAFHNRGVPGHASFGVRLRGPAGNPTAIGARVAVEYADGSLRTAEVQAGGGYASQSTATLFFGFAADNPAKKIHVTWPGGRLTEHAAPATSGVVTLPAE